MKLKSWMEAHIVRSKRKNKKESKKDKHKKSTELTVTVVPRQPLDSAGNSPSSPDPPDGAPQHIQSSPMRNVPTSSPYFTMATGNRNYVTVSNRRYLDSPSVRRQQTLCPCFSISGADLWCLQETSESTSVHSPFHVDRLSDNTNVNSPRQRSKIRTNPWLTPKMSADYGRTLLASCSSVSDCGSLSEYNDNGHNDNHCSHHQRDSFMLSTEGSDVSPVDLVFPHDPFARSVASSFRDGLPTEQAPRAKACLFPGSELRFRRLSLQRKKKETDEVHSVRKEDSDSEECETLNEMGNFDELYEYDRETDILDDVYDAEEDRGGSGQKIGRNHCHRGSKRRHQRPPPIILCSEATSKLKDLYGNDEDYSEKLEFVDVDEAYSEASGSLEEDDEEAERPVRIRVLEEEDCGTQTDSAFPSDSEFSSLMASAVTTPSYETATGSSSGSDSGFQPRAVKERDTAGRSLECIRESLEDKVRRLRLERLLVDEKIREAKEEENLRRLERERFQKELIVHRRQVLLRTLQELRLKLEEQSSRLHDVYQTTLEMQLLRRRQALSDHEGAAGDRGWFNRSSLGRLM